MLEKLQYRNHLDEVILFGQDGFFVNENDLRDFAWSYTSKNNRLSSFQKGVVKKTLTVIIACTSEKEGLEKRNALFEVCEKDVLAKNYGKFIIGDYYIKCYVAGSKKTDYLYGNHTMKVKLTVVTDSPAWMKESTTIFRSVNSPYIDANARNLDYPHDYSFDYGTDFEKLVNTDFVPTNFRMAIYGPCTNPEIVIADHKYNVETEIADGEYLVIDSDEKTINLIRSNGEKVNCFNKRNRESYVFEKILPGGNMVIWDGKFGFDVTLFEERSEPKWT